MDLVALNVTGKDKDFLKNLKNGSGDFSNPLMEDSISKKPPSFLSEPFHG